MTSDSERERERERERESERERERVESWELAGCSKHLESLASESGRSLNPSLQGASAKLEQLQPR